MAEPRQLVFKHKEVVEALIRHQDLREGVWGLFVRFGIQAANIGASPADLMPAAIIPILEIGLQRFEQENNISVDAAKVNPPKLPLASTGSDSKH